MFLKETQGAETSGGGGEMKGTKQGRRTIRIERKLQGKGLHKEEKREVFSYNGKGREEGRTIFAGYVTSLWNNTIYFKLTAQTVVTDPGVIENSVWKGLC